MEKYSKYLKSKYFKIGLLVLIIFISSILAYQPHFSNPYPILTDEYVHISLGKYISEDYQLPYTNPYVPTKDRIINLESGFHYFLALTFAVLPGEPVLYYKYFIPIFIIINSLLLFYLVTLWFRNYYVSLLSVLFYGMIKSTGDFLAHNYFIPLTLGISLLLLNLIFFSKWERSNENKVVDKYFIYLVITILATAITYPPTLTFFIGILFIYILSMNHNLNEKLNIDKKAFLKYFLTISAITGLIGALLIYYLRLWKYLIFHISWTPIQSNLSPIFFFGIIPSLFAFMGLMYLIQRKNKNILVYWFIFSVTEIWLFYVFDFTILVPFRRLFMFYLIGMGVLAGVGIVSIINHIKKLSFNKSNYVKIISIIIILILIVTTYYLAFTNPLNPPQRLNEDKYQSLIFIKENYPKNTLIISDGLTSTSIHPITRQYISGIIASNIGAGSTKFSEDFLNSNCEGKKELIESYKGVVTTYDILKEINMITFPVILITDKKENCEFLTPINNQGFNMYEVKINN